MGGRGRRRRWLDFRSKGSGNEIWPGLCVVFLGRKFHFNLPLSYQEVEWYQRTAGKPDEKIRVGWGKLGGGKLGGGNPGMNQRLLCFSPPLELLT